MAKKNVVGKKLKIVPESMSELHVTLIGETPLIVCRFSERAAGDIERGQSGEDVETDKAPRIPHREFRESIYFVNDSKPELLVTPWEDGFRQQILDLGGAFKQRGKDIHGFPVIGVYKAMKRACKRMKGVTMTDAPELFSVMNDGSATFEFSELTYDTVQMRRDRVVLKKRITTLAYRAYYTGWSFSVVIRFKNEMITAMKIVNLLNRAGGHGVGAWRGECDGIFGKFGIDPDNCILVEERTAK